MHRKADRNLETKEGETMSQLGQKNLQSHYHIKKPLVMLMYSLALPKTGKRPNQYRQINQIGYISITRGGEVEISICEAIVNNKKLNITQDEIRFEGTLCADQLLLKNNN